MNYRGLFSIVFSLSLSLLAVLCCTCSRDSEKSFGGSKTARERALPDTIKVAFYNVENLFDFNLDGTEYDEYKPGWFGWTEDVQKKKMDNVARVVAALRADIVGLCEIENLNTLKELQRELDKIDAPYPYAAAADAPKSATVTALLSKYPIKEKFDHPVEDSRPILEALIAGGGDELRVFVNHWPSKRHPESKRVEAARILRQRLEKLPPGSDYIIIGDFNANHNEFATFHTEGLNDTKRKTGINHVLKTVMVVDGEADVKSPTRFVCKCEMASCGDCHYNLWLDLPEDKRMSYVYRGAAQTMDNILLPPSMLDRNSGYSYLNGSFEAFTMDNELLREGAPYRWQMFFRGKEKYHAGKGYSDHLPIKADFVKAIILLDDTLPQVYIHNCESDPGALEGDFAVTVDGWMPGDSHFSVSRCNRFAKTGTHSLKITGAHDENRTAAKVCLESQASDKYLTLSVKGSGSLSFRVRRPSTNWAYYNAPDFKQSKSAKYKNWKSDSWVNLRFPLPYSDMGDEDVQLELRAGKGEPLAVWIDRVRLE